MNYGYESKSFESAIGGWNTISQVITDYQNGSHILEKGSDLSMFL